EEPLTAPLNRALGGILWLGLPLHAGAAPAEDAHAIRLLEAKLAEHRDGDLIVVFAGPDRPLRRFLDSSLGLASRVPSIITFPPYSPAELTEIFAYRAREAGFTLTPEAAAKAGRLISQSGRAARMGSARLAMMLLDQAAVEQARRVMGEGANGGALAVLPEGDIPDLLVAARRPGQPGDPIAELDGM